MESEAATEDSSSSSSSCFRRNRYTSENDDIGYLLFSLTDDCEADITSSDTEPFCEGGHMTPIHQLNNKNNCQTQNGHPAGLPSPKTNAITMKNHWKHAIMKARSLADPWEKFHLDELCEETATRYRYNAIRKNWVQDTVVVKIEDESFACGAMRECYRMKKLSNFARDPNWKHASNYVAKRYITEAERDVYFEDIRLQMDAKLWGEEFNRHNPPKKVDIFQLSVIEFKSRPGSPLYHLEHFIEGHYIKYNSNSGFVDSHDDDSIRCTPHAFSHFTFERSSHELIVVDVQGVGDLYTDPQIHTIDGEGYGDGNLGTKGMALFFHTHVCNRICTLLALSRFDLHQNELRDQRRFVKLQSSAKTAVKPVRNIVLKTHRLRHTSGGTITDQLSMSMTPPTPAGSWPSWFSQSPPGSPSSSEPLSPGPLTPGLSSVDGDMDDMDVMSDSMNGSNHRHHSNDSNDSGFYGNGHRRQRYDSDNLDDFHRVYVLAESEKNTTTREEERRMMALHRRLSKPSCVADEIQRRLLMEIKSEKSILGQIHMDLAKYHENGRFVQETGEDYDDESCLFHLKHAADCGILEAIVCMSRIYLHLPSDSLPSLTLEDGNDDSLPLAFDYMDQAAAAGDRRSMVYLAKAYDNGQTLSSNRKVNWTVAAYWYDRAVSMTMEDDSGEFDAVTDDPAYILLARQAEMYHNGGHGLEKDPQKSGDLYTEAADAAMSAMKGRLANKYYALAEEAWAECEDPDEAMSSD